MTGSPDVSVLISVYNEEPYVEEAIESILTQTYDDFELVVIDDGSTDGTRARLRNVDDPRMKYVENDRNVGFVRTLNQGLDMCSGKYVARMDADDVARRDRIEKQVRFLESHPEVGIVGSYWENFADETESTQLVTVPETDAEIRWNVLLHCPFGHPTVLLRRRVLEDKDLRYSPHYSEIEDYELWPRVLKHTQGANIPEPLLAHRVHEDSRYQQNLVDLLREHDKIALRTIREYVPEFETTQEEVSRLRVLVGGSEEFAPYDPRERTVELVERYLELLGEFAETHRGGAGLDAAKRTGVETAVSLLFNESVKGTSPLDVGNHLRVSNALARAMELHPQATIEETSATFGSTVKRRIEDRL
ncbi:glycosyltransferase family 2 protein [Halorussus litoreus]|uniref:glycosyltransferase family 2 protein n=1 Tax=Halorussus litoreus TaxID=1710536 RepID=UPI0013008D1D|nr:glycosyltransferase [Halorussus litoreus]